MEKQEIHNLIKLVQRFNGNLSLSYIPQKKIKTPGDTYGLYHCGWSKIEIGDYYRCGPLYIENLCDKTIDKAVDDIYITLNDCIGKHIDQALTNLNLDYEDLKYFDRNLPLFQKFQDEVQRLKQQENPPYLTDHEIDKLNEH
jgi:hypothetical protein